MMPSGDDVPTTIVCHFDEPERVKIDDDIMTDGLDVSMSLRSSLNDSYHPIDDRKTAGATATDAKNDHVTDQELCAMKDMVASMRRNPELLNLSPVMQKACLTSSPNRRHTIDRAPPTDQELCAMKDMVASMRRNPELLNLSPVMQKACLTSSPNRRHTIDRAPPSDQELSAMKDMVASMRRNPELLNLSPVMQKACLTSSPHRRITIEDSSPPGETYVAKNEDLSAMKDMIASIRKNPLLLYQSPVMQKACATTRTTTTTAVTHGTPSFIYPHETTPPSNTSTRRPLGSKFDPSTLPTLPLPTSRGVSINKKSAVKAPSSPTAVAAPSSVMKMDTNTQLSKIRPRSI